MSRKKVKLQWIANDAARRATFKKRRKGLMKKVQELSVLCDVKACAVVYGPYEPQPEVWPSPEGASAMLRKFRSMPELEQSKKMMNQEGFLQQRIDKIREQIRKEEKANRELETEILMRQALEGKRSLQELGMEELTNLGCMVEMKLKDIQGKIGFLRGQRQSIDVPAASKFSSSSSSSSSSQLHPLLPPPPRAAVVGGAKPEEIMNVVHAATTETAGMGVELFPGMSAAAPVEGMRQRDWIMEMIAPHDLLFYGGEEAVQPLLDGTNTPWMDPYFPFN